MPVGPVIVFKLAVCYPPEPAVMLIYRGRPNGTWSDATISNTSPVLTVTLVFILPSPTKGCLTPVYTLWWGFRLGGYVSDFILEQAVSVIFTDSTPAIGELIFSSSRPIGVGPFSPLLPMGGSSFRSWHLLWTTAHLCPVYTPGSRSFFVWYHATASTIVSKGCFMTETTFAMILRFNRG